MAATSQIGLNDRLRLGAIVVGHEFRTAAVRLYTSPLYRWRFSGGTAHRLIIAPPDLHTADPTAAEDIYSGRFSLVGQVGETGGGSPFSISPPSPEWAAQLHGFGWLRHLRAAGSELARTNARALVLDWMSEYGRYDRFAWRPEVVARRLISWLSHSPLILEGADQALYRRFMRSLTRQSRFLYRTGAEAPAGAARIVSATALCHAGLCMSGRGRLLRQATRWLVDELDSQILPDGGHVGRNPRVVVELLLDLLPLRQTFTARDMPPPQMLVSSIDRMMPMLRFFRHADGALAQFNGMGATQADELATLMAYDEALGAPVASATHSGYERLAARGTVVIADVGRPPPPTLSTEATASCLAFEMSAGGARMIVNCGAPLRPDPEWRRASRATAAHSTATINDTSSARFARNRFVVNRLGPIVASGPRNVSVDRADDDEQTLVAAHDGYAAFGIVHRRSLALDQTGGALRGQDEFVYDRDRQEGGDDEFALRFHLHPGVKAGPTSDGAAILLVTPPGEAWEFRCGELDPELEESVFLGGIDLPRRTQQIVLHGTCRTTPSVSWRFDRIRGRRRPAGRRREPLPELPLAMPEAEADPEPTPEPEPEHEMPETVDPELPPAEEPQAPPREPPVFDRDAPGAGARTGTEEPLDDEEPADDGDPAEEEDTAGDDEGRDDGRR